MRTEQNKLVTVEDCIEIFDTMTAGLDAIAGVAVCVSNIFEQHERMDLYCLRKLFDAKVEQLRASMMLSISEEMAIEEFRGRIGA
jgi:hypothetical protein